MKPALRKVATVTRVTADGKRITGPAHWFATERAKAPVPMKEWMQRHEGVGG